MSAKLKGWCALLPVHPAAEFFPLMSEGELRELADDIKEHGQREPVALYKEYPKDADGNVSLSNHRIVLIDGRKRLHGLVGRSDRQALCGELRVRCRPRLQHREPARRIGHARRCSADGGSYSQGARGES
jgi:hypothetical protein